MRNILLTPPEPKGSSDPPGGVITFRLFLFPGIAYAAGLISGSDIAHVVALLSWPVIFLCSALWGVWRITDRQPADDLWRAVAIYVFGSAAWLLVPILYGFTPSASVFYAVTFPLVFALGCWALIAARREDPPALPPSRRAAMLWIAILVCAIWMLALAAPIYGHLRRPDVWPTQLVWIGAPLIALNLFVAVGLGRSARKGYVRGRPLTAESLLADPPHAESAAP